MLSAVRDEGSDLVVIPHPFLVKGLNGMSIDERENCWPRGGLRTPGSGFTWTSLATPRLNSCETSSWR